MKNLLHVKGGFRRLGVWPVVLVFTGNRHVDAFRVNAALFVAWSTPRSLVPRTSPNCRCSWVQRCGIHEKSTSYRYHGRGTRRNRQRILGSGDLWTLYSWTSDDGGTDDTGGGFRLYMYLTWRMHPKSRGSVCAATEILCDPMLSIGKKRAQMAVNLFVLLFFFILRRP